VSVYVRARLCVCTLGFIIVAGDINQPAHRSLCSESVPFRPVKCVLSLSSRYFRRRWATSTRFKLGIVVRDLVVGTLSRVPGPSLY